jgi:hypothetical protein
MATSCGFVSAEALGTASVSASCAAPRGSFMVTHALGSARAVSLQNLGGGTISGQGASNVTLGLQNGADLAQKQTQSGQAVTLDCRCLHSVQCTTI